MHTNIANVIVHFKCYIVAQHVVELGKLRGLPEGGKSGWSQAVAKKFVAFLSQIPPRGPVVLVRKCCTVYNLRFCLFHGMEEIVGSIPTRSTKKINHL